VSLCNRVGRTQERGLREFASASGHTARWRLSLTCPPDSLNQSRRLVQSGQAIQGREICVYGRRSVGKWSVRSARLARMTYPSLSRFCSTNLESLPERSTRASHHNIGAEIRVEERTIAALPDHKHAPHPTNNANDTMLASRGKWLDSHDRVLPEFTKVTWGEKGDELMENVDHVRQCRTRLG
jgi:hypothetical protein